MKFRTLALPFCILASASITSVAADLCLGSCGTNAAGTTKECTFHVKVDMHASERGYYNFDECEGNNPTLGEYISYCTCWCRIAEMLTACACCVQYLQLNFCYTWCAFAPVPRSTIYYYIMHYSSANEQHESPPHHLVIINLIKQVLKRA